MRDSPRKSTLIHNEREIHFLGFNLTLKQTNDGQADHVWKLSGLMSPNARAADLSSILDGAISARSGCIQARWVCRPKDIFGAAKLSLENQREWDN